MGLHQGNVCFIGEALGVELGVDNTRGTHPVARLVVTLIENIFLEAPAPEDSAEGQPTERGTTRVFKRAVQVWTLPGVGVAELRRFEEQLLIDAQKVRHPSAIGRSVACYYVLQAEAQSTGFCVRNQPRVSAALFLMAPQPAQDCGMGQLPADTQVQALQTIRLGRPNHAGQPNRRIGAMAMNRYVDPLQESPSELALRL